MKRWPVALVLTALVFSLTFVSCDAMFESNLFSKLTHDQLDVAAVSEKTPAEMQALTESDVYMQELADTPELKTAALDTLAAVYDPSGDQTGTSTGDADGQLAAVVAVDILIQTDPSAAAFSAGIIGSIESISSLGSSSDPASAVVDVVSSVLPYAISSQIAPGATMPDEFATMVETFTESQSILALLGDNLAVVGTDPETGDPVYGYAADVSSSEALSIAINAAISTLMSAITPASGYATTAEALWAVLCDDPSDLSSYLSFSDTAMDATYLSNLMSAAGLSL
jgi:hypothetical protein